MEPRTLQYVARACGAALCQGDPGLLIQRVCTDSRRLESEDLFFALSGPRFDAHAFVDEAARKQAAGVVVAQDKADQLRLPCAVLGVDEPRRALGRLAGQYRAEFDLRVVAVAGSNGKTTAKNLLASVLRQKFRTLASEASFNNDVGVPLTLLRLERRHEAAVLEAGTNHPGELAPLLRMIRPQLGVLTGLGGEHLEFFGDLEGVAREEGWLAELLPPTGRLFVDGDSHQLSELERRCPAPVVHTGFGPQNAWRASQISVAPAGTTFVVASPRPEYDGSYRIRLLGRHQVRLALLALAVGVELGLTRAEIEAGLAGCEPADMRLQLKESRGRWILDDSYNANVDSMRAALETCHDLPCSGRRVALLGDMAELGDHSAAAHTEVGRLAAESGMDMLVAVGQWRHHTTAAARAAGLKHIHTFETIPAAAGFVERRTRPGDLILLKASRAASFERFHAAWEEEA